MGADDKSVYAKCGEILVHIKSKNWKTKIYQYNCAYCNVTCNQLNKFSKHIELKHFRGSTTEPCKKDKPEIYEAEINNDFEDELKAKPEIYEETNNVEYTEVSKEEPIMHEMVTNLELIEKPKDKQEIYVPEVKVEEFAEDLKPDDPLGSRMTVMLPTVESNDELLEEDDNYNEENVEDYTMNDWAVSDDNDNESNDSEAERKRSERSEQMKNRFAKNKQKKQAFMDNEDATSSDDSRDADFDLEQEIKKQFRRKPIKKKQPKPAKVDSVISEPEIIIDETQLTIALLNAFERQPKLWDLEVRTMDKDITQTYYEMINNEVNEKLHYNIKWQDARKRILKMRHDYAIELEKQRKGEECEIPWYAEHMKYLKDNLEYLLRNRHCISKYRPLKTMDDNEFSSLIELYKKKEILWQVNNLAFGIIKKKDEMLEEIRKEFSEIINVNITPENLYRRLQYMYRLYSKNKQLAFKCELENSDFIPSSPFYKQMSFLSDSRGPFKCSTCNEIIESYEIYHIHVAKHNNVMPFICPQCQMGFEKYSKYLLHTGQHLGLHNYCCGICGKSYPIKGSLDHHVLSHTGVKPYLCPICGERFRGRYYYNTHMLQHENRYRHNCEICDKGFYTTHLYQAHVKKHLNIREFVCNICGKAYFSKKHLKRHELTHSGVNYECNICNKKFSQKSSLQTHQKVHGTCVS